MGVPLLLTWLKRRFASCFLASSHTPSPDCLYIDVNGIVYQAAALATASEAAAVDVEAAILRRLFDLLDDIVLRLVLPKSLVYLAVDGISPMGKLAQQRARRRRRRSSGTNFGGSGSRHSNLVEWDSNSISVGTPFMSRLTDALHFYCASRTERINGERLRNHLRHGDTASTVEFPAMPITFVVDDVWRPGEGENKIVDAIRRFRSQPDYDPNTSHVICSSDTDVTVCSLILHEPRIHVLRYEYQGACTTSNESKSWRSKVGDRWASTFFSIHLFREELRAILRLQHDDIASVKEVEKRNEQFERALHDVVFVLLLFGNDFLPSLGCRIEEGFLDDLLELLATDFVSRERSIVDPDTNTIQFEAARYALESLAEMCDERSGGGLSVNKGVEGAADWGFVDEKFLQQKQVEEEQEQAPRCYAYWTMLQWSLHNSAGLVDHWGCYYPYSSAPPLHLLRKYCGTLSYDALMELAAKRNRWRGKGTETQPSVNEIKMDVKVRDAGPTDVLVQLLVLLPARSAALFPSAIRNAYAEIEPLVVAPVECIDYVAIEAWCAQKRHLFTAEERTRYSVYALAAGDSVIAGMKDGDNIRGNELLFVADWDARGFAEELQSAKAVRVSKDPMEGNTVCGSSAPPLVANTTGLFTSSFFSSRPGRKASAAVAALISAPKDENIPQNAEASEDDSNHGSGSNNKNEALVLVAGKEPHQVVDVEVVRGSRFILFTAPTDALADSGMVTGVGAVVGDTFLCGQHRSDPISRNPRTMRFRLRWRLASKPPLNSAKFVPNLLPGYNPPPVSVTRQGGMLTGVKRGASDSDTPAHSDEDDEMATHNVMVKLQERKEAVRRRLQALQGRVPVEVMTTAVGGEVFEEGGEEEVLHGKM